MKPFQFHSKAALKAEGPFAPGDARLLSNFSQNRVEWDGATWPTAEHAFQAAKGKYSVGPATAFRAEILNMASPVEAKKAGGRAGMKQRGLTLDVAAWDGAKDECMYDILKSKADLNADVRAVLDKVPGSGYTLFHFSRGDTYWGGRISKETGEAVGQNVLGKTWLKVLGAP